MGWGAELHSLYHQFTTQLLAIPTRWNQEFNLIPSKTTCALWDVSTEIVIQSLFFTHVRCTLYITPAYIERRIPACMVHLCNLKQLGISSPKIAQKGTSGLFWAQLEPHYLKLHLFHYNLAELMIHHNHKVISAVILKSRVKSSQLDTSSIDHQIDNKNFSEWLWFVHPWSRPWWRES